MRALMLQGTGSDVGKSILVAGLCRALVRRGIKVLPFKPQNMSNNAAPADLLPRNFAANAQSAPGTSPLCGFAPRGNSAGAQLRGGGEAMRGQRRSGGEIGRAQALQAQACCVEPNVHMNPVLLKPQTDTGAQVIVRGKLHGTLNAQDWNTVREPLLGVVLESFEYLKSNCAIVVVEGAGSPAEINLRRGDIANMGFARAAQVPVVLIGDIDRGGVIAQIVGTKAVLDAEDAAMIRGFIVNKFRGRVELFYDGYVDIEKRTGWKGFGIIPWLAAARSLPAEDAIPANLKSAGAAVIAVPVMPHISNHDDFDALEAETSVRLVRVMPGTPLPAEASLVVLPGSKSTISDLEFFRAQGWDIDLAAHIRRGGFVLGICGGYQMMGKTICDPEGIEGGSAQADGLGLLPCRTTLLGDKRIRDVEGASIEDGVPFTGYEIHIGKTELEPESGAVPFLKLSSGELEGAKSANGRIAGCYIHRLFDDPRQRAAILARLGAASDGIAQKERVEAALDAIAAELEKSLDIDALLETAG